MNKVTNGHSSRRLVCFFIPYSMPQLFYIASVLLLLIYLAVSAAPATAATLPGVDMAISQSKTNGIDLLQNGKTAEAYDIFMRLLRETPDDDDVNLGIALSAYSLKKYSQALMAYERLIIKYPRDARLRLQIANVYMALEEVESARLELEKARQYDPTITEETIEKTLGSLEKQHSPWQFSGRVSMGVMYDTNSNQGPGSNTMTLGRFQDIFVEGVKEKASWAPFVSAGLEGGYRLGQDSPFWIMSDVMGYQRWNTNSGVTTNNSFTYGRAALGGRYVGKKVLLDARLKVDSATQHHKKAEDQDIFSIGPELTAVIAVLPSLQSITRVTYEKRDYTLSNGRDGKYWSAGQFARVFFGEKNHEVMLGVTVYGNDPNIRAYKFFGTEPMLRVTFKLPYDLTLAPYVAFREDVYDGPATGLETRDRIDDQWRMGANLTWDVNESFAVDLGYQYIDTSSTSKLYEYDQNITSMSVTWKF